MARNSGEFTYLFDPAFWAVRVVLSVGKRGFQFIIGVLELAEFLLHLGMAHRDARVVIEQILLGYVGDVGFLLILGQQVIIGLVLAWAHLGGNCLPPLLGVVEFGIHIEYYPAEGEKAVVDDLSNPEFCIALEHDLTT